MSLLADMTRSQAELRATRRPVSWAEEAMRNGVEAFYRERFPGARIVHELVMDRGKVRADVCAIGTGHLVAAEIKSGYDAIDRLITQAALFRLACPELWLFVDDRHARDAEIIHYLMPTIGFATCGEIELRKASKEGRAPVWSIRREARLFRPDPEALLSLLWVGELTEEAVAARIVTPAKRPLSHGSLVKRISEVMSNAEMLVLVCRQLRMRTAQWRADPPDVPEEMAR